MKRQEYICKVCNKLFYGYKSRKTCSKTCQSEYYKTELKGATNPNYRHGRTVSHKCQCGKGIDWRAKECRECAGKLCIITKAELYNAIIKSKNYMQTAKLLSVSRQTITRLVNEYNINISHFEPGRRRLLTSAQALTRESQYANGTIKKILKRENLIKFICASCGIKPYWNNQYLELQLHHIDGIKNNNEIDNLVFLCPNCHSQTSTFTGRNSTNEKKERS